MTSFADSLTSAAAGMTETRSKSMTMSYTPVTVHSNELLDAYRGSWEAQKFIDKRIEDSVRKWREWVADPEQVTSIEETERALDIKSKYRQACTLADVTGRAFIYIDTNDNVDRAEPIDLKSMGKDCIRFVTVLATGQLVDGDLDDDPMSETYGYPKWYHIASTSGGIVEIHPSRVAVFYGKKKVTLSTAQVVGESLLIAAFPALKQYGSTMLNVADLVFEAKIDVLKVKGLMEQVKTAAGADAVAARYNLLGFMKSNNGMMVLDQDGEDYDQKKMSFATLPDIIKATEHQVAAAGGYPHAIFMGAASGGLGSTGNLELSAYYDSVSQYQENKISGPASLLDKLLVCHATGSYSDDITYNWRALWQMTDKEKAEIGKLQSDMLKTMLDIFPVDVVAEAAINMMTESGTMSGLEGAVEEYGTGVDNEDGAV